jgi:phage terminase small subunit
LLTRGRGNHREADRLSNPTLAFLLRKSRVEGVLPVKPPSGLSPAARAAYTQAEEVLGGDATRFRTALLSYVHAVDVAARARAAWVKDGRPFVFAQPNRAVGVDPGLRAMMDAARAAVDMRARLGLDPASAKRIDPQRRPGRPMGAASAPDRRPGLTLLPEPAKLTVQVNRRAATTWTK